ncbi:aminoglycoside 6'-N-acetyltransferase [Spirosoma soli]|uniref:Aminoglycoside N(6')-acetyltransferase type 1 n=1 Tax=Spirosoma soli TaxID=1770529 RepID=A0ABW5M4F6_9BACT
MTILEVTENDADDWLQLALELWPDYSLDEMNLVTDGIAQSPRETAFIVRDEQGTAIGFMNLSLRHDYVPGATQQPVAYVEGLYVREPYQKQGIGRQLIHRAEQWARDQGCSELASDVLIDNAPSAAFHSKAGFEEVERTIFFIKNVT